MKLHGLEGRFNPRLPGECGEYTAIDFPGTCEAYEVFNLLLGALYAKITSAGSLDPLANWGMRLNFRQPEVGRCLSRLSSRHLR